MTDVAVDVVEFGDEPWVYHQWPRLFTKVVARVA